MSKFTNPIDLPYYLLSMLLSYYKRIYPNDILVYIEEYNKKEKIVLFDFIDSNEYSLFSNTIGRVYDLNKPSMILLNNYTLKTIQENTIYAIKPETIIGWQSQITGEESQNSFLIGYRINARENTSEIFMDAISLNDEIESDLHSIMHGSGDNSKILFHFKGKLSVIVRNVHQGNWNEVICNDEVKIVYDAGGPMNASKNDIRKLIFNRNTLYKADTPILILSHWDKDHYHSLLGMSDSELKNNFSVFICRDRVPNLTSRILFGRLRAAVGAQNTFTVPAYNRFNRGGPTHFYSLTSRNKQIVLYNSQHHKNRNISGLALVIKSKNKSIILPGDAHYKQISKDILIHLNYPHKHCLVVPHHGGDAGKYTYSIPSKLTVDRAIISVGANSYGHPFAKYIGGLKTTGFRVEQTNIANNDIMLNL